MSENGNGHFTEFKDEADRARETRWRTGFIVVMDEYGRVFVDNNRANFGNSLDREATTDDAIYMLSKALDEFKTDQIRAIVMETVKLELIRVGRTGQPQEKPGD